MWKSLPTARRPQAGPAHTHAHFNGEYNGCAYVLWIYEAPICEGEAATCR